MIIARYIRIAPLFVSGRHLGGASPSTDAVDDAIDEDKATVPLASVTSLAKFKVPIT